MLCKVDKSEAPIMNLLADQAFNAVGAGIATAVSVVALSGRQGCFATSALVHAVANQLILTLISHRQAHGEFAEIRSLAQLRAQPELFLKLVEDANELFAAVLRGLDPKNDYMLNMFRVEKSQAPEKKE